MKQLLNKTLITLTIFFGGLALPAGEAKADTFSAGYTTATINIDKTNYFVGESIIATASITALWCRNTASWSYIHASTKPLNTDFGVMVVMLSTGGSYSLPLNVSNTGSQPITAPLTPGSYTMNFEAVAPAVYCAACTNWGALAYVPRSIPFTVSGGASISSLNPPSGTHAGGTSVVITGTNFTGASALSIGWTNVPFIVNSPTQITFTTPARAWAGSVPVSVTTPMGTPVSSYTYTNSVNPPTISGATDITPGVSHPFTLTTSDIDNDQVRYGVDWDNDNVVDEYTAYVNPSTPEAVYHNWATVGTKTFQARAQDAIALNSAWTPYTVNVSSQPAPTLSFATSGSLNYGSIFNLNWYPTDVSSCTATGDWSGSKPLPTLANVAVSESMPALVAPQTYTLSCLGLDGTIVAKTLNVTPITAPPSIGFFFANPSSVAYNNPTKLIWNAFGPGTVSCFATASPVNSLWSGAQSLWSGGFNTSPLTTDTTFELTCSNAWGSDTKSASVTVTGAPAAFCPNTICETGENPLTCPQDCKVKYRTF